VLQGINAELELFKKNGYLFKGKYPCILEGLVCNNLIRLLNSEVLSRHFGLDKTISYVRNFMELWRNCQVAKGTSQNIGFHMPLRIPNIP